MLFSAKGLIALFFIGVESSSVGPEIDTPLGIVRGFYKTSYRGKTFAAFEGIPYAEPPVGNLRFEEALSVEPWVNPLECLSTRRCASTDFSPNGINTTVVNGEEDCLYLNVYSPNELPAPDDNLPVVVYIHGGGFSSGSSEEGQPTLVVDRNLMLVSINYRLGTLGFLCSTKHPISCNVGLKDQNLALQWIQHFISYFGGNRDSVTIVGHSAGAASVHYHMMSPLSEGLFHKAFSMSGTALNPWAFRRKPEQTFKKVVAAVGCSRRTSPRVVECLKSVPFQNLVKASDQLFAYRGFPMSPLGPTLEEEEYSFLPDTPFRLLFGRRVADVPWLVSVTSDEGLMPILRAELYNVLDELNREWENVVGPMLDITFGTEDFRRNVATAIKERYFGEKGITLQNILILVQLFSDRLFLTGFQKASLLQATANKSLVYNFMLGSMGNTCFANSHDTYLKGVSHIKDLQYIFKPPKNITENEEALGQIYLDILESFARNGKPALKGVKWSPSTTDNVLQYLYIESPTRLNMKYSTDLGHLEFWENLKLMEY